MTEALAAAMFAAILSAGADGPAGAASTEAPTQSESLVRAQVNAYLGSNDVTARNWRDLGPAALPHLTKAVSDRDLAPPRRVRAVQALSVLGSRSDAQILLDLARLESEPSSVRLVALQTAVKLLPKAEAVAALRPLLKGARTSHMRAVAAEHLTRLSKRHCAAVRAQVDKERPREKKQFRRALRRCPPPESSEPAAPPDQEK